jgi:hypothetical protein
MNHKGHEGTQRWGTLSPSCTFVSFVARAFGFQKRC